MPVPDVGNGGCGANCIFKHFCNPITIYVNDQPFAQMAILVPKKVPICHSCKLL